jgi:hypothetical protein
MSMAINASSINIISNIFDILSLEARYSLIITRKHPIWLLPRQTQSARISIYALSAISAEAQSQQIQRQQRAYDQKSFHFLHPLSLTYSRDRYNPSDTSLSKAWLNYISL